MTGRVGRWLACHPPCSTIADWVTRVRLEIASEYVASLPAPRWSETQPEAFIDSWHERLAAWGLSEDPLATDSEIERARRIAAGASPADLPRAR